MYNVYLTSDFITPCLPALILNCNQPAKQFCTQTTEGNTTLSGTYLFSAIQRRLNGGKP